MDRTSSVNADVRANRLFDLSDDFSLPFVQKMAFYDALTGRPG